MNCKKCGTRLADEWKCCPSCGTEVERNDICKQCGYKLLEDWKACPACGCKRAEEAAFANDAENTAAENNDEINKEKAKNEEREYTYGWNNTQNQSSYGPPPKGGADGNYYYGQPGSVFYTPATPSHPMKWYKFLVKFFIWFTAAASFLDAVSSLTAIPNRELQIEMGILSEAHTIAYLIFEAIVSLALGAYAIRIGILLRKRSKKSLSAFVAFIAASPIITVVTALLFPALVNIPLDLPGTIVGNGLLIWANIVYFNKRKDFFCN